MSNAQSQWSRFAHALVVVLGLIGTQNAQAQAPKPESPVPLSIILATPAFYSLPVSILLKNGAEFGVKLELFELHGGGEAGAVFAGGNGDILAAGIDKLFGLRRGGIADVLAFGVILTSANWSLVAPTKSQIKGVKDLKGKTIGISGPGSSSDMLVRYAVRGAGLDPDKDVTLIALGSVANLYAGIENDRVAAGVLVSPFLEKGTASGMTRVADADWERMEFPNNVLIARRKDIEGAPRAKLVTFMSAYRSVLTKLKTDRPWALRMAKMIYPQSPDAELERQLDFAIAVLWQPMDVRLTQPLYDKARAVVVGSGRFKDTDIEPYSATVVTLPEK